jgi:hypothetical protein
LDLARAKKEKRKAMRNNRWLAARILALFALSVPLGGCLPGCGALGLLGLVVKSEDPKGNGIPDTRIAVLPMPAGGTAEVESRLRRHEPFTGWLVNADVKGVVRLDTVLGGKQEIPAPQQYAFDAGAGGYSPVSVTTCGPAEAEAEALSPQEAVDRYAAGGKLCLFAEAPGYQPFVGVLKIERRGGKVRNVELETVQGRKPRIGRKGATLTLQPVSSAG